MPGFRTTLRPRGFRFLAAAALAVGALTAAAFPTAAADPLTDAAGVIEQLRAVGDPLPPLPAPHGPTTAIVVLGYGLLPDGGMRPELVARLQAALVQAMVSPASPIIVTGGNPRGGTTEADAMAGWLVGHGIAPERIHIESRASDTVENAVNSAEMMHALGAGDAVVVTSADHMPRAVADFVDAGVAVVGTVSPQDLPPVVLEAFGPQQ
ncbi:YdcF family protein [Nocardia violaceofusca]|uniref:YdcF family protein n=1 Tax=Nocardia violaceofusca TaxID=941182 RepID=UPI0007A495C9|nr:YdcF family protein [Nocardia violaceofusca]